MIDLAHLEALAKAATPFCACRIIREPIRESYR